VPPDTAGVVAIQPGMSFARRVISDFSAQMRSVLKAESVAESTTWCGWAT
jgi:hypothetical protein